jgi:elongator complex protein 3
MIKNNDFGIYWSGSKKSYDKILGFARLRLNESGPQILPILQNKSKIRELHVYSFSLAVNTINNKKINNTYQHKGYGQKLVQIAEHISKLNGCNSIAIISGVGVREYYKNKLGYHLENDFMIKNI